MALLALDVGNTSVTLGFFEGRRLVSMASRPTAGLRAPGKFASRLKGEARRARVRVTAAVYASVVPSADRAAERAVRKAFACRPLKLTPSSRVGMRLKVERPRQVGSDRIANALAARELSRGAAVVIDSGTAVTFDCVSRKGDYLGGAIAPGPRMQAQALAEKTARLPFVEPVRPGRVIGKSTAECIQAGVYFGYLGMIREILERTLSEMKREGKVRVYAAGGMTWPFRSSLSRVARHVPELTLAGLRIAYERMRKNQSKDS